MPTIPLITPVLDHAEADEVRRVILSGWVTQGPEVELFEKEFASFVGAPFACAVSSCTAALHTALVALDIGPGDEVITVSHSFIATANAVRYVGATPVFVDVDPVNGNLDASHIFSAITERTRALIVVHQLGMPSDMKKIMQAVVEFGLPIIEDAACAIGSEIFFEDEWQRIGRPHGTICCFSFHPRKLVTTGDGGMLTTADPMLDQKFRLIRHHGMTVSDRQRHSSNKVIIEEYALLGYNYRLTDIQAAVGRVQLRRLPEIIKCRRELANRYHSMLSEINQLDVATEPEWAKTNWQTYTVRLSRAVDQIRVMQAMLSAGISTRRGVMCAHREPAYLAEFWRCIEGPATCGCEKGRCRNLFNSEDLQNRSLALPLFQGMTEDQQRFVITVLAEALAR